MIKIGLIILSAALVVGVIIYSWFNRDSDRVILTLVTAMTIGSLGFITKESISNKIEKVSKEFPVAVFFGVPDYRPLNIKLPYGHELSMCLQEIKNEDLPKDIENVDISYGQDKYFDALQYLIIKEIFKRFSKSWNVVAKQTHVPGGKSLSWQSLGDTGKEILINDILEKFPDNYFLKQGIQKNIPRPFGGMAIFPPSTKISIENDENHKQTILKLATDYINVTIKLTQSSSSVGIGEYSQLIGLTTSRQHINVADQQQYGNAVFILETGAEQNVWLNGHPDMKTHRNWANSIIELLDSTFNYELIREEHLREFQLYGPGAVRNI